MSRGTRGGMGAPPGHRFCAGWVVGTAESIPLRVTRRHAESRRPRPRVILGPPQKRCWRGVAAVQQRNLPYLKTSRKTRASFPCDALDRIHASQDVFAQILESENREGPRVSTASARIQITSWATEGRSFLTSANNFRCKESGILLVFRVAISSSAFLLPRKNTSSLSTLTPCPFKCLPALYIRLLVSRLMCYI